MGSLRSRKSQGTRLPSTTLIALATVAACATACGGADDADPSTECLSAKGDSDALADGAFDGTSGACTRLTVGTVGNTIVVIEGGYGVSQSAPRLFHTILRLLYPGTTPAVATFDETSPPESTPAIEISYSAATSGGQQLSWSCKTGNDTQPAQGTFHLAITSVVSSGRFGTSKSDTIRGTLHAVCPPASEPVANETPGKGRVTIDGWF